MLRRDGHEIVTAGDAQEGLRRWAADRPELIALDNELLRVDRLAQVIVGAGAQGADLRVDIARAAQEHDRRVRAGRFGAPDARQ